MCIVSVWLALLIGHFQYTVNNDDYAYGWVFEDDRFQLKFNDERLLDFLCEVFHPAVKDDKRKWRSVYERINRLLRADGYELYIKGQLSGRNIYGYRQCDPVSIDDPDSESEYSVLLNSYKVEQVGRGGFGEVFRYHNDSYDIDFAVKELSPMFADDNQLEKARKRFSREAKMLFSLNSKYIARIYDIRQRNGNPCIWMEYVDGCNLYDFREKNGGIEVDRIAIVIRHILAGLKEAHSKRIIHRDLKPSNVMFSCKENVFKIIDFGMSAYINYSEHTKITVSGEHPAGGVYIDPLIQNDPSIHHPGSDIYSVGAIWFYLLTGSSPKGSDMKDVLYKANPTVDEKQRRL